MCRGRLGRVGGSGLQVQAPTSSRPTAPTRPCAVCFLIGEFVSTSRLVAGGTSGSVNISVWGTPDRCLCALPCVHAACSPAAPSFSPVAPDPQQEPSQAQHPDHTPNLQPRRVRNLEYAAGTAAAVLPAYEAALGLPYPLPKLDLVAIPDFSAGAMENWGGWASGW